MDQTPDPDRSGKDLTHLSRILMDAAPFALYRYQSDGRIIEANRAACTLTGYRKKELCGMTLSDIETDLSPEEFQAMWQALSLDDGKKRETVHVKKDGTAIPVEITTRLAEVEGRSQAISFAQDISDRKQTGEILNLLRFGFNRAPIGIFHIDSTTARIINVNEMACKMLGYEKKELQNKTIFDIDPDFPPEKWPDHINKIRSGGPRTIESIHRHKSGRTFPVQIAISMMEISGTEYHLAFVTDISERKSAEKNKMKVKTQMIQSQKMESLGTLAGGIAHDFNNVLGAILGYTNLVKYYSEDKPEISKHLDQIEKASLRAKDLVRQILAFSRQSNTDKIPVDIGTIVKEVIKLLRASIPTTIEIYQDVTSNQGTVLADQTQIHQLVMNLCTNAYQAMSSTGGTLTVTLHPTTIDASNHTAFRELSSGRYLDLVVADTGCGMDEKTMAHMFDPYFTTKEPGEGTGLGLAVAHGIVKELGGDIRVASHPGQGTEIHVLFPVIEKEADDLPEEVLALPSGNECILFVDDEKVLAQLGKDLLEDLGYEVETQTSPFDAIEKIRSAPDRFDLLITDMTMPKMTGDRLAHEARRIRPDLPVILCTGFSSLLTEELVRQIDCQEVLMKPITYQDLAVTVRKILDTHNPRN